VSTPLSWIDVVWLMAAGACLSLALVHGGSWLRQRSRWADLHFAVAAIGVFGVALVETFEMRAQTAEQFLAVHNWIVFALLFAGLGLAGFVHAFFGTRPAIDVGLNLFVGIGDLLGPASPHSSGPGAVGSAAQQGSAKSRQAAMRPPFLRS